MPSEEALNGHVANGDGGAKDVERNAKHGGGSKWRFSVVWRSTFLDLIDVSRLSLTLSTTVFVFSVVVATGVTNTKSLGPPLAVPFVGTATNAVVGALIVSYSNGVNARLAIPVIVVSYLLCGLGIWAGILVFSLVWSRFMNHGPTPPAQSPGLFLLVAPPGQVAAAVILLGYASSLHFGSYDRGTFFTATSGTTLSTVGIFFGLLVLGLSVFFIFFALYTIIDLAFRRQHSYSLIWWSTIFPLATVDTAFIGLATSMNSPAFMVLAEGLFLILFIVYVLNAGFTLMQIAQGKLLSGRRQEEGKEK
nr:putative malic acid transport protein [Quercus suber]